MRDGAITLVTENADMAFWTALRCTPFDAPAWVAAITGPDEIMALPDGVKCLGLWFSSRKFRSEAEQAWIARRLMGGVVALDDTDWKRLTDWMAARASADVGDGSADTRGDLPTGTHVPHPDLRDLVMSQRWV